MYYTRHFHCFSYSSFIPPFDEYFYCLYEGKAIEEDFCRMTLEAYKQKHTHIRSYSLSLPL